MERKATNNPVVIVAAPDNRFAIENEGGEQLALIGRRKAGYSWCRSHNCQPIKSFKTMELEDRWSQTNWFNVTNLNLKGLVGARKVLQDRSEALTLALWNHEKCKGWVLYARKAPRSKDYKHISSAGDVSLRWKKNQAIYWAESTMWIGMEEPSKTDLVVYLDYSVHRAILVDSGFRKD